MGLSVPLRFGCQVIVDERSHCTKSLLHPCLADGQGPALVLYLPGVVLKPDDVIAFMSPNRGTHAHPSTIRSILKRGVTHML